MQKNKSFQKVNKTNKEISSCSSRALLELSQITNNSKDKSLFMQNFSQRSGYPSMDFEQTQHNFSQTSKPNQKAKSNPKKQTYIRQKAPLSNSVITQIMQISNSLPIRNDNFESARFMDKQNGLIVFSKADLQKNKNFSQTKKSKKLLLYDNKENIQKPMSKTKSSISQIIKVQPILCSIKIQPLQEQKSHNVSTNQKRQSLDGRRSSFSSRRSSINLFPQDDFVSEWKTKEMKKSFVTKNSENQHIKKSLEDTGKMDNFLKKSHINFCEENCASLEFKAQESRQTCENETQITPRQKKQIRQKYILKLDELNIIEEDIRKQATKFIPIWNNQIESEKNLKKYRKAFQQVKSKYEKIQSESYEMKNILFEENKHFVTSKRLSSNNFNSQKQNILLEVQKIHNEVKKKVFKKDLEEMMVFNMKVVLPSSQLMESSMSCFDSQISSGMSYSNISILQLYEELMNQRACKKYGMILKKEINNMNIYDNRTMNEYLKRLFELEVAFNKVQGEDPQNEHQYLQKIQNLVDKIQQIDIQLSHIKKEYSQLEGKIKENEQIKSESASQLDSLFRQISESVYEEYKLFQTGGRSDKKPCNESLMNESFTENEKPISQFRELVGKKYEQIFKRYKEVKDEKRMVLETLNNYQ